MVEGLGYWNPEDVKYFRPPDKRVQVNLRIPTSLKAHINGLMRLWKLRAELDGADPKDVDFTYVCEQLLRVGVDGAWKEVGELAGLNGMPQSEDEWTALGKALSRESKSPKK